MGVRLEEPPVGVRIISSKEDLPEAERFSGVSYCEAVKLAGQGRRLIVSGDSIKVCKWVPVVLGFKEPADDFERSIEPRFPGRPLAYYLARLDLFGDAEPDVVIIRGSPRALAEVVSLAGEGSLTQKYAGKIGKSAVGAEAGQHGWKKKLVAASNRALAGLNRFRAFDRFTRFAFRSRLVTRAFERLIRNTLADMSVCRNSTVIPYLEDAGNISFFCPGGVTWGGNRPYCMTGGFPYRLIKPVLEKIEYP